MAPAQAQPVVAANTVTQTGVLVDAPKPAFAPVIPLPAPAVIVAEAPGAAPLNFVLGFAFLKVQLGPTMGEPLELEHGALDSCDTQQRTTTGLAYWRCSTNTMSFAAAPDGLVHWAWLDRLITWRGESPEPTADAIPVASAGAPNLPIGDCLMPGPTPATACALFDGATTLGFIVASGQANAYRFDLPRSSAQITAELVNLPADYDLYLVDGGGGIVAQSMEEGFAAERIDALLDEGSYYLFVHSDPGRAFDAEHPYSLHLSYSTPTRTAAPAPAEIP